MVLSDLSASHFAKIYNESKLGAMIDVLGRWTRDCVEFNELYDSVVKLANRFQNLKKQGLVPGKLSEESYKKDFKVMLNEISDVWSTARYLWLIEQDETMAGLSVIAEEIESVENLIDLFEQQVADEAMLELNTSLSDDEKAEAQFHLEQKLDNCRKQGFALIVGSKPKDLSEGDLMKLFDSDFFDFNTKLLFVSALLLGCLNFYDSNKATVLYRLAIGDYSLEMKQRALVAFVMVGLVAPGFDPEYSAHLDELCKDKDFFHQLGDIQRVMRLEDSADKVGSEVFTSFMKGLFTEAALELSEHLKDKADVMIDEDVPFNFERDFKDGFERIVSREEEGADVYFSQFKKLKEDDFFNELQNWFIPFYNENPHLKVVRSIMDRLSFLKNLNGSSTMCDSDAYSFLLSMKGAPEDSVKEWGKKYTDDKLDDVEDFDDEELEDEELDDEKAELVEQVNEKHEKTRILRRYIHDLYRFFELAPMRSSFVNPFEFNKRLPLLRCGDYSGSRFDKVRLSMARFGAKHKDYEFTEQMLLSVDNPTEEQSFMQALVYYGKGMYYQAVDILEGMMKKGAKKSTCLMMLLEDYEKLHSPKFADAMRQLLAEETDEKRVLDMKLRLLDFYLANGMEKDSVALAYQMDCDYPKTEQVEGRLAEALMFSHPYSLENIKRASVLLKPYASNLWKRYEELGLSKEPTSKEETNKKLINMLALMLNDMAKPGDPVWRKRIDRRLGMCLWALEGSAAAKGYIQDSFKSKETTMYLDVPTYDLCEKDQKWLNAMGISSMEISLMLENLIRPDMRI